MNFAPSSRARLTAHDLGRFRGDTLFARLGRVLCHVGRLPRKELYEAWEVARRVRRLFRGGRVVDLAGGHGLLAHAMLLLDDTSPEAVVVDRVRPGSQSIVSAAITAEWPRLAGRIGFVEADLAAVPLSCDDVVVSSHGCGALTDAVLIRAADARARVAVLPCCHDHALEKRDGLSGWLPSALGIDVRRAVELERRGYRVWTQAIPDTISPKNRLLLGRPLEADNGEEVLVDEVRAKRVHDRRPRP